VDSAILILAAGALNPERADLSCVRPKTKGILCKAGKISKLILNECGSGKAAYFAVLIAGGGLKGRVQALIPRPERV
jgi:hypothetical protein